MAQGPTPTPVPADPPPTDLKPSQGEAPDNLFGLLSISPAQPTNTWPPASGTTNRLSPQQTATITVDVAESGDANGASYKRKEMSVMTGCNEPDVLWIPSDGVDNENYQLTNTARTSAWAQLVVSAIWEREPNSGSGEGDNGSKDDITGLGTANLELLKSVVEWNLPNYPQYVVVDSGTAKGEFNAYIIDQDGWPITAAVTNVTGANYNPSSASWEVTATADDQGVTARRHDLSMTVISGTVSSTEGSKGNLVLSYDTGVALTATSESLTMVPVEFRLLNGDQSGKDGVFFDNSRPTTCDDPVLQNDNFITATIIIWAGTNQLGTLPIGQGRMDVPLKDNSYVSALLVVAKVAPDSTGLTYSWKRSLQRGAWMIERSGSQWNVYKRGISTGFPNPINDTGSSIFYTTIPSPKGILYYSDTPGSHLGSIVYDHLAVDDYVYEEKDFTYTLTISKGSTVLKKLDFHVGQTITAKRIDRTGTVAQDWEALGCHVSSSNIPSCKIDQNKVISIVGSNNGTINIHPDANNDD